MTRCIVGLPLVDEDVLDDVDVDVRELEAADEEAAAEVTDCADAGRASSKLIKSVKSARIVSILAAKIAGGVKIVREIGKWWLIEVWKRQDKGSNGMQPGPWDTKSNKEKRTKMTCQIWFAVF